MNMATAPRELVLASAGSGKTYRISSRLIGLLAYGEPAERILAASFTRKAAGQIFDRVLARLAHAALDPREARELAQAAAFGTAAPISAEPTFWAGLLERLVDDLHRLDVGTLDAFFIRAALAFGNELDLPAGWRISDFPSEERMRSEALQRVLADGDRAQTVELVRLAARGGSRRSVHDRLLRMADQLLEIQDQIDPGATGAWSVFEGPAGAPVDDAVTLAALLSACDLPRTSKGTVHRNFANAMQKMVDAVTGLDWEELIRQTLSQRVLDDDLQYSRADISPEIAGAIRRALELARFNLRKRLSDQIDALGTLTGSFVEAYREIQRRESTFSFGDITRLIGSGDPLIDRGDLYYRLDARTAHLLLDEFQDTSLAQWEALAPLADEVLSDGDRAAVVVADPKQSIYGWRGAEPAVVRNFAVHYDLGGEHLARSYRSSGVVLDFVNEIFTGLPRNPVLQDDLDCRNAAEQWVEDFREHVPAYALPGYVAVEAGPAGEGRSSRKRPQLYRYTAQRVAELAKARPGFTIGILARTNDVVARLFLELRRLNLEVSQEGGNPLTDTGVCEAILSLIRLADHPADTIARYHVANSPLGPIFGLRDHRQRPMAELAARRMRSRLIDDGYGETISSIAKQVVGSCSPRDARRLFQLTELAHRYDSMATLRPADFIRMVEAERMEDPITADIRVMTIHQAKGLEFDIVVLPQLDESILQGGRPPAALPVRDRPGERVTAVLPAASKEIRALFPELEVAERQRKAAILRDGISTLYVALTRARYALHAIVAADGPGGQGSGATPARIIRAAVADTAGDEPVEEGDILYESGSREWYAEPGARPENEDRPAPTMPPPLELEVRSGARRRLFPRQSPSDLRGREVDLRDILRVDTADALDRGSIIHAWFELVAWSHQPAPNREALDRVAREISPHLDASDLESMAEQFHGWLGQPDIAGALAPARYGSGPDIRLVVERELPFLRRVGEGIMEGIIDRVVVTYRGDEPVAAEVIDFKTDRVDDDEAGVRKFATRYREQLSAYADAVSDLYRVPRARCTAALILLERGRVVDVQV